MQVTLFTPTYGPDLERFRVQRESIERCGIELPHVAVVQHEHLPLFRDLPFQRNLTLVSTRDVLPPEVERRRRLWGIRRRNPRRWLGGTPLHGWFTQQLLKLASPSVVSTEGIVCIDSDTLFVGRVEAADFYDQTGKLHLYETFDDVDAEMAEWVGRSMRFLGVKPTKLPVSRFTHSPTVLHRQIVLDMHSCIAAIHHKPWMRAVEDYEMITEYATYGVFAKYVDGCKRVTPTPPRLSAYFWWAEEVAAIDRDFASKVKVTHAKMVAVQSNSGILPGQYRPLVAALWP
jgi:Family of unknown function (DUF6492)